MFRDGMSQMDAMNSDGLRNSAVGRHALRVGLLEVGGVEVAAGVRVKVGREEAKAMDKGGVKETQAIMATARQLSKDGAWDLVVAVDGSSEGEGDVGSGCRTHSGKDHMLSRWGGSRRPS